MKILYNNILRLGIVILLTLPIVTSGCKKEFLERPPLDELTTESFYLNDEQVLSGTAALYHVAWFEYSFNTMLNLGDIRAGNMISNDRAPWYQFSVIDEADELRRAWNSLYIVISHSNYLINNLENQVGEEVSDEIFDLAMAEAHFMRGMAYSYLVMNWGPVPIIYDNIAQLRDTSIAPATEESIWEFIIRDVTYAANYLPEEEVQPGRLTKWSAMGALSRLYLYRASFRGGSGMKDPQDLDSARYYAGEVCNNSGLTLLENYADLFKTQNDNNEESLFAFQWVGSTDQDEWANGTNNTFQPFYAFQTEITGGNAWGPAHGASADILKEYMKDSVDISSNIRRKATFMLNGDIYTDLMTADTGLYYESNTISNIRKYIVGTPDENDGIGTDLGTGNNTYVLRLAEVYLNYAEAILGNDASTNDAEALLYYNQVRERAGLQPDTAITWDDIRREKRLEFALESVYWYELVAWYYRDKEGVKDYIAQQDKGSYTVEVENPYSDSIEVDIEFPDTLSTGETIIRSFPVSDQTFFLPIPGGEATGSPNLFKDPEPFDFSLYK